MGSNQVWSYKWSKLSQVSLDLPKLGQNKYARKGRCHKHALGTDTAQNRNYKTNMFAQLNIHVMYQFLNSTKRKIALTVDRHRGAPDDGGAI